VFFTMNRKHSELKIGIISLLALIILITAIMWGKGVKMLASTRTLTVQFDDIAGLEPGAFVLVNGMKKGKVLDFILQQEGILVHLAVASDVKIYSDARFIITATDLMGSKLINIAPGTSGVELAPDAVYRGDNSGGITRLMDSSALLTDKVEKLLDVLEITASNINATVGDPQLREMLLASVRNLDESTQKTRDLLHENASKLNEILDNLVMTSAGLRELVVENGDEINQTVTDVRGLVVRLNEVAAELDAVMGWMQSDSSTIGSLLTSDRMAVKLEKTVSDLDSLVNQIRDEGIRTRISLFGKRKR
jgi:phospholipid/cholesterol/gamma-HCH transport system substrate-binding protein